jgi:DNA-binding response OmpR family regulator
MKPIVLIRKNGITEMIEMALRLMGYPCLFAEDLTEDERSAGAIIDLESLGVFGEYKTLALAQRMTYQFPGDDLLFLTTNEKIATSLQQEGHSVLTKPFHMQSLVTWISCRVTENPKLESNR